MFRKINGEAVFGEINKIEPIFLDPESYWQAFVEECFYEKRAKDYDKHIRYSKRNYNYEDVGWFQIVRHRYEWEWWKDFIGIEFVGAMTFHKDEKGFQYLNHVTPLSMHDDGKVVEGKIINATALFKLDAEHKGKNHVKMPSLRA